MASLQNFPNLPDNGNVSVCERNGHICLLPAAEIDTDGLSAATAIPFYPEINIGRELFHHASLHVRDDHRALMVPVNEPSVKKFARILFEEGAVQALHEAANTHDRQHNPIVGTFAKYMLMLVHGGNRVKYFFKPHLKHQGLSALEKCSQTRDWSKSVIRCLRWHPNCFKLAVAASDDSIRIYTDEPVTVPILKSGAQKSVTCLAWRPFTAGELAVGCQNGTLIWSVDPNSLITRPLSQAVLLRHGNNSPVSAVDWSPNGCLLATASVNDANVLIWDVDLQQNVPLRRVGSPGALLSWSPDGARLCTTTVGGVFRLWETKKFTHDQWIINSGAIQSMAWSVTGSHLLFVTTEETYLYCLTLVSDSVLLSSFVPNAALPIADLSKISQNGQEVGGKPQALAWCPNSQHLAITFKDTPAVAIYGTTIYRSQLNITATCLLTGIGPEYASCISFQQHLGRRTHEPHKAVLTIGWSNGRIQYFPFA